MSTLLTRTAEALGWNVEDFGGYYEIQRYTPAGEDWIEYIDKDTEEASTAALVCNFDIDEQAEILIPYRGTRGVPESIAEILEDQRWKKEQLEILCFSMIDRKNRRQVERNRYRYHQAKAREAAQDWQREQSDLQLYWSDYAEAIAKFEELGRRYGLKKEFKENGIL